MTSLPALPESELEWLFSSSSGPGGQNVNKTATKVQLRWNLLHSSVYTDQDKLSLVKRLSSHLSQDGFINVTASESRSQAINKQVALRKLQNLLLKALTPPKPRRQTKPTKNSKLKRRANKQKRSQLKLSRKPISSE